MWSLANFRGSLLMNEWRYALQNKTNKILKMLKAFKNGFWRENNGEKENIDAGAL